jgi:hypothetical protein
MQLIEPFIITITITITTTIILKPRPSVGRALKLAQSSFKQRARHDYVSPQALNIPPILYAQSLT